MKWGAHVRFVPKADIYSAAKARHYSITSSAPVSSVDGTTSPNSFAALRLITNSNFVGCAAIHLTAISDHVAGHEVYKPHHLDVAPSLVAFWASHHQTVGNAAVPNFGIRSGWPKRSHRALRTLL
jgi:hypothetical protein